MNQNTDNHDFNRQAHWEHVYSEKKSTEVSWFQQQPQQSLELIKAIDADATARIIDIGGGASTLVDYLLDAGYQNLSVLDIAQSAIEQAKSRIGERAEKVEWFIHDVTSFSTDDPFDIWHDRAVFHFLTDEDDRKSYVHAMSDALKPGAHVIIATFNLDGPDKCSGLNVVRYSPESMSAVLGDGYQLVESITEAHETPRGTLQDFVYCRFKRV